ncbi:MAG TPA: biotin transporter BioY [Propionicimonas sp.]|mgnify:CR=1 FL=1|nr:biotin transporter BioY [Propionicimonas sp.]HRA06335.1 biotin transporter BioY [Propionicimonas sp.]
MPDTKTTTATDLALIAVFAALIAAFSLTPAIPIGIGVPITLQTLAVVLAGLVLGPWRGSLATLLYLAVGFAGLPVFAGGAAGLAVLAKPSVGYLLAFPIGAAIAGFVAKLFVDWRGAKQYLGFFLAGLAASLFIHAAGIVGLMLVAKMSLSAAFLLDLAFWPGDVAKMFVASAIAVAVHRAFPALLARRQPAVA